MPAAFGLVLNADRRNTILLGAYTATQALLPVGQAYTGKLIVDGVVNGLAAGLPTAAALQNIWPYLVVEFALFTIGSFIAHGRRLAEQILNQRAGHAITQHIIRKALTLEMRYFEDSRFYDGMQNARRESDYRALAIINGVFSLAQNLITLLSFLFVLLAMSPIIAIVLFLGTIPAFAVQTRYSKLKFRLQSWRAPETRMLHYLEQILTMDTTVKEIKLFRLGAELLRRFDELFQRIFTEDVALARRRLWLSYLWGLVSSLSFYGCYAWIIYLTVAGRITLGDMTLYLGAVRLSQGSFQGLLDHVSKLYENGLFMENLFFFLATGEETVAAPNGTERAPAGPAATVRAPGSARAGIEFRAVSFRYPNREEWAIENLNLEIRPGEKFAVVGENGSGKTTLIKLLTRLYEPTAGAIFLDGVDIRQMEPARLHERIGVIFQDFVRYQLTLRENLGFGDVARLADTERVLAAAKRAGADDLIEELPEGLESVLGTQFQGGRELSLGQWQKIAIGRAFMRQAEILILDEPTASLDAEKEFEIFRRFQELTAGRTAILISHRFSTVRMADRIAVLQRGVLRELGTHDELVRKDGIYARLFDLQARGYR